MDQFAINYIKYFMESLYAGKPENIFREKSTFVFNGENTDINKLINHFICNIKLTIESIDSINCGSRRLNLLVSGNFTQANKNGVYSMYLFVCSAPDKKIGETFWVQNAMFRQINII